MYTKNILKLTFGLVLISACCLGCVENVSECKINACGSCGDLLHTPGDGCDGGTWVCDASSGGVVCQQSSAPCEGANCPGTEPEPSHPEPEPENCEKNACGSCGVLPHTPGDGCSNGTWECDGSGGVVCQPTMIANPCGGMSKLDYFDYECGECGTYQCDGPDNLKCDDPGKNACGECGKLDHEPGEACENGKWTCNEKGNLECKEANTLTEPNACGGMTEIGEVGAECGVCGKYECAGTDALKCNDPGKNACGGCNILEHAPGEKCGDCGQYVCSSNEAVQCDDPGKNACGGCNPLTATPGASCGAGGCGKWTCQGTDEVVCGSDGINACGGCSKLAHQPGDSCDSSKKCCVWECDDKGGIRKNEHDKNACGGCDVLENTPSTKCENGYGTWECDKADADKNTLTCACEVHNECGGCDQKHKPGDRCWMCDRGFDGDSEGSIECNGTAMFCKDRQGDVPEKAQLFYGDYKDSDDETHVWFEQLEYESDTDFIYIENVEDSFWGVMKPEFFIPHDLGFKLCVYILEHRHPASVDYTCSGTGMNEDINLKMKVSATEPAELVLKNGTKYTGFCTKPVSDAEYKYIQIGGFSSTANNSFSAYISISSDGTNKDECREYTLKFRF